MSRPPTSSSVAAASPLAPSSAASTRAHTAATPRSGSRGGVGFVGPTVNLPLDTLVSSALDNSRHERAPSRIAPHAHRPAAAAAMHANEELTASHNLDGLTAAQRAKSKRDEELRAQIRRLDAHSASAAVESPFSPESDRQYRPMDRPHANPMWVVPPPKGIDELLDLEGDAWIAAAMVEQKCNFDRSLHPQMQVRLSALQGDFNTRDPEADFLRGIAGGSGGRSYDPLHGLAVTSRGDRSGRTGNTRNGSRSSRSARSAASSSKSGRVARVVPAPASLSSSFASESACEVAPLPPSTRDGTKRPSGKEFEPIPPVPYARPNNSGAAISDRELLAQVFDDIDEGESSAGHTHHPPPLPSPPPSSVDSVTHTLSVRSSRAPPPPPLQLASSNASDSHTSEADVENVPLRLLDGMKLPISLFNQAPTTQTANAQHTNTFTQHSEIQPTPMNEQIRTDTHTDHATNTHTTSIDTQQPISVSWSPSPPADEVDSVTSTLPAASSIPAPAPPATRPHSSHTGAHRSGAQTARTPASTNPTSAPPSNGGGQTAHPPNRPRPRTGGSQTSRTTRNAKSRPGSSGYVIPSGISTFGYTDREVNVGVKEALDSYCSGSAAQPLQELSRPRTGRSDVGGSSGLATRGCGVRYRSIMSDYHDPLSAKLHDARVGGDHLLLNLKSFRRDVELLTNTRQITNQTLKRMLNEHNTSDRIAWMRREADRKRNLEAGSVGTGGGPTGTNGGTNTSEITGTSGITQKLYQPVESSKSTIPAKYSKLAGTNITPIHAPDFGGAMDSNPFRQSANGRTGGPSRPLIYDSSVYLGPGSYHPSDGLLVPSAPQSVFYGPPRSNWINHLDKFQKRTQDGPGTYKVNRALQEKRVTGLVEYTRTRGRGEFDFMGVHTDLKNPSPGSYESFKHAPLWSDELHHRHSEHAFGHTRRFDDTAYKLPAAPSDYLSRKPERMLALAGPRDGPGTLHKIIPTRTSHLYNMYDPNMDAYLTSHGIPSLDSSLASRYLTHDELVGSVVVGDEDGDTAESILQSPITGPTHITHTRAMERDARELDVALSLALGTTPKVVERVSDAPSTVQQAPVTDAVAPSAAPAAYDLSKLHSIQPPNSHELKLRNALFPSSTRMQSPSPTRHTGADGESDLIRRNRIALAAASPRAKEEAARVKRDLSKTKHKSVLEKATRLHETKLKRWREKIAAADEALMARTSDGLFVNRWLMLFALASRTSWMHRVLEFSRRMRSEHHRRDGAARIISREWRRYHERRLVIRRQAALLTLSKIFGTFRVRLRIRRKQKAANLLRTFFKTIAAAEFEPPLAVHARPYVNAATNTHSYASVDDDDPQQHAASVASTRRKAMLAKLRMKNGGDRTLVGLIRHFKSQVIIIQRAWRAYCMMREFQAELHLLYWDQIQSEHFQALYSKLHGGPHHLSSPSSSSPHHPHGHAVPASPSLSAATMFQASAQLKPAEKSKAVLEKQRTLRQLIERDQQVGKKVAENREALEEKMFQNGLARSRPMTPVTSTAAIAATNAPATPSAASTVASSPAASPIASPSDTPVTAARRLKFKPVVLKMDARFTTAERRQIVLEALKQRKLRYLRVKRNWLNQQAKFVRDESQGVSAARRLLESEETKFSSGYFARQFARSHPPPYLPRMITHRQMVQLMNAASLARKETRKTRYNLAQTNLNLINASPHQPHHGAQSAANASRTLFSTTHVLPRRGFGSPGGAHHAHHAHEFDLTEMRMRTQLLHSWASQIPIPTRPIQLTPEEEEEERIKAEKRARQNMVQTADAQLQVHTSEPASKHHSRTHSRTSAHPTPGSRSRSRNHSRSASFFHGRTKSFGAADSSATVTLDFGRVASIDGDDGAAAAGDRDEDNINATRQLEQLLEEEATG